MSQLIVHRSGPLRGASRVPGDKSISHRALLLGALAEGDTHVTGWLPAADCQATLRCVRTLGISVEEEGGSELLIHGAGPAGLREPAEVLDCGGSGTTLRLLAGLLAGQPFFSVLTGSQALRRRPMDRVAEPLRSMGAEVWGRANGRLSPLAIRGGTLRGAEHQLPIASAQVKSALLLAGLYAEGETVIHEPGPSRDHTERMLRAFGASVCTEGASVRLAGGQALRSPNGSAALAAPLPRAAAPDGQRAGQVVVPGDFSSAAFLLVAAAIVPGSEVWLRDVGTNPTRTGLYDVLASMGAEIGMPGTEEQGEAVPANGPADGGAGPLGEPAADLFARSSGLLAGQVAGDLVVRMIDEFPIFAVAATQAEGMTTIRDAAELRVKESDRISSVVQELGKLGARIDELPDGMLIHGPARLQGTRVDSHRDHRLAMALAVAGLVADGETVVEDAGAIDDSFPGFTELMRELGADMATEG